MESNQSDQTIPKPIEEIAPELATYFKQLVAYNVQGKKTGKLNHFDVDAYIYHGVGRNDPCPCGAKNEKGEPKKFKKCCMAELKQ